MMLRAVLSGVFVMGVTLVWAGTASANNLAPALARTECVSNNPGVTLDDPAQCQLQGALASAQATPYVSLVAQLDNGAFVGSQGATAALSYQFEVVGGVFGTYVPVTITTNLHTLATNYGAYARITTDYSDKYVCSGDAGLPACQGDTFTGAINLMAQVGHAVNVDLIVSVSGSYYYGGSAYASADPLIAIDPNFLNADNYSIEVSDGVANALPPSAPEPTSWALLVAGFGFVGTALRRERSYSRA